MPRTLLSKGKRPPEQPSERRCVAGALKAIHAEVRGAYGWPRTWKELLARGIRVGKERVRKLMQLHGIRAKGKRRFKVTTTDSNHDSPISPNLLNREFTVAEPDKVWGWVMSRISRLTKAGCFWPW